MALTAPTVASDPGTAAEISAAFVTIQSYAATAASEALFGFEAAREILRIHSGNKDHLDKLDGHMAQLKQITTNTAATAADNVAATINNGLATAASNIDLLNLAMLECTRDLRNMIRLSSGSIFETIAHDVNQTALGSPSTLPAASVATNSQANINTGLATTTAFLDTSNAEVLAVFNELLRVFATSSRKKELGDLASAVTLLSSP